MATKHTSSNIGTATLAVLSGAFLAGAMLSITLLTIPVILDATPSTAPQLLLDRWFNLYHYGHRVMPGLAVATCLLYVHAVRSAVRPHWRMLAGAGAATFAILPFTWFVMGPTNNALFQAQAASEGGDAVMPWDDAFRLVTRWTWLHTTRSMMPLIGAGMGMWGTVLEIGTRQKVVKS